MQSPVDPSAGVVPTETSDPGLAITYQAQFGAGKTFILQVAIPRDGSLHSYHDMVDKMIAVVERIEWKARRVALLHEIDGLEKTRAQFKADYDRVLLDATAAWKKRGKQGDVELNKSEETNRKNSLLSDEARGKEIEQKKQWVADLEKQIAESEKDV